MDKDHLARMAAHVPTGQYALFAVLSQSVPTNNADILAATLGSMTDGI